MTKLGHSSLPVLMCNILIHLNRNQVALHIPLGYPERCHNHCFDFKCFGLKCFLYCFKVVSHWPKNQGHLIFSKKLRSSFIFKIFGSLPLKKYWGCITFSKKWGHLTLIKRNEAVFHFQENWGHLQFKKNWGCLPFWKYWGCLPFSI